MIEACIILFIVGFGLLIGAKILDVWKELRYPLIDWLSMRELRSYGYEENDYKLYALVSGLEMGSIVMGVLMIIAAFVLLIVRFVA